MISREQCLDFYKRWKEKLLPNNTPNHDDPWPLDEDLDYASDTKAAIYAKKTRGANVTIAVTGTMLFVFMIWAKFSVLEEVTKADASVIPSSKNQLIQHLEGGIVEGVEVRQGQIVKKNQILMRLSDTRFSSELGEKNQRYLGLLATLARLKAQANGLKTIDFPEEVRTQAPERMAKEIEFFKASEAGLSETLRPYKTVTTWQKKNTK